MNMYVVRMMHFKHLQFATDRTVICMKRNLSCSIFPGTFPFQHKKFEKRWQCSKLQTLHFHTTQRLHVSPLFTLMLCGTLQFASIASGYFLRTWYLKQSPAQQEELKKLFNERKHKLFGLWGLSSAILLIIYLMNFEQDPITGRPRFMLFSKDDQVVLGNIVLTTLLTKYKSDIIPISDPMYSRLKRVLRKLANANIDIFKDTQWTISVINAPMTNAMVLPGGNVFVFTGMFNVVENDDQLTFVLAHEISHVLLLHTIEMFSYTILKQLLNIIPSFLIWLCFSKWKAVQLYLGTTLLQKLVFQYPYQRRLEHEADEIGLQLSAKSCIDVREVLFFWELMAKYSELTQENKYQIPILMTHPSHKEREKRLALQLPKALELRDEAGCPKLPSFDPRKKLKRYIKDLEERFRGKEELFLSIVYPKSQSTNTAMIFFPTRNTKFVFVINVNGVVIRMIIFLFITIVNGYNVDINYPTIRDHIVPTNNGYFGYSVHLYHDSINNLSWLLVGEPKGNTSFTQKNSNQLREPGTVYKCLLGSTKPCQAIAPKNMENKKIYISRIERDILIQQQDAWFGSAISIDELNGILTVCAPRTIARILFPVTNTYYETMHGVCYSGNISWNTLLLEEEEIKFHDFTKSFWYNPIHGFSIHYASLKQNKGTEKGQKGFSRIIGEPKHESYGTVNIEHSNERILVELPLDDLSQFGYSVESGYFFEQNQLLYVSSAPGWHYVGQVMIINPTLDKLVIEKVNGSEIGEFFGASLAVGDLDNDGFDDLLVGAPYWGEDNGKVYIYLGTKGGHFRSVPALQGTADGGYFGYALASGDLDADGFDDIIVGAPWENFGVVYIYNGNVELENKVLQVSEKIQASRTLQRFGFSISKPVDIDGNGYSDIAVGAYKSQTALVFHSKPVVRTKLLIRTIPNTLERDAQQFSIEICPQYDGYNIEKIQDAKSKIVVTIDEQYERTTETRLVLESSNLSTMCHETRVNISKNIQDFIEPIRIVAKHEFVNERTVGHCNLCPVEKNYNKLYVAEILLPFNIGCGIDTVCNSNISVAARFYGTRHKNMWIIGSEDISFEVNLKNHGEPAYLTTLEFTLPESVLLRTLLPSCREDSSKNNLIVICNVGNPLGKEEEKYVKLDLDMKHLIHVSLYDNELHFHATIKTRSTNHGKTNITETLYSLSEVSLSLNGKANEEMYYLSTINNNISNITFEHTYQVYKLGVSPIEDSRLIIKVPMAIKDLEPLVYLQTPQLYLAGEVFECSLENVLLNNKLTNEQIWLLDQYYDFSEDNTEMSQTVNDSLNNILYMNCSTADVNCTSIVCNLNALKTSQNIGKVSIKLRLNIDRLKDIFANNTVILKFGTQAEVKIIQPLVRLNINGTRSTMEITTTFYNASKTEELQLWIIIISVSIGLLLLLIFSAILSTLGFFKRKSKQEFTNNEENTS
ncbi:integrin alpha-9 [Calliopsis andreniformis]|uniref:integrin alpha-9 n=1 Tax=Calliopsis andreniformis TaxID=337506 RepID=UPI003FCCCC7C